MVPKSGTEQGSYRVENQIGFMLRVAFQYHTSVFTSLMIENLTQTQFAALSKIKELGQCSQSDLIRAIALDTATVNGVIARMRTRGLVQVSEDPGDRRRKFLTLTSEGMTLVNRGETAGENISAVTLSRLSNVERGRLVHLLRKMMGTDAFEAASGADVGDEARG